MAPGDAFRLTDRGRDVRRCAVCGASLAGKRADAITCSNSCRSALRRKPKGLPADKMRRPVADKREKPGVEYVQDYGTWYGDDGRIRVEQPPVTSKDIA